MRLMIDTNRYSDADRGDAAVISRFERASELWVPLVVLGELRAGFAIGNRREENERNLAVFLTQPNVSVTSPDEETATYYAQIKKRLHQRGRPIPTNDVWIAAQALQHNVVLDTRDSDFDHIEGLRVLDA